MCSINFIAHGSTELKFQMEMWVFWHIAVKINEKFTNNHQLLKTPDNCFGYKHFLSDQSTIFHEVKIDNITETC